MYLENEITKIVNMDGVEWFALSSDKYVIVEVNNMEDNFSKKNDGLPYITVRLLKWVRRDCGYEGRWNTLLYIYLIGVLRWNVEVWRVYI